MLPANIDARECRPCTDRERTPTHELRTQNAQGRQINLAHRREFERGARARCVGVACGRARRREMVVENAFRVAPCGLDKTTRRALTGVVLNELHTIFGGSTAAAVASASPS